MFTMVCAVNLFAMGVAACGSSDAAVTNAPDTAAAEAAALQTAQREPDAFFAAVSVADVQRSSNWYQRVLGFSVVRTNDLSDHGVRMLVLKHGTSVLELVQEDRATADDVERAFMHFGVFKLGFRVPNLDLFAAHLESQGIPLRGRVVVDEGLQLRSLQVVDPDGNIIQVFEQLATPTATPPASGAASPSVAVR